MNIETVAEFLGPYITFTSGLLALFMLNGKPDFRERSLNLLVRTKSDASLQKLSVFLDINRKFRGKKEGILGKNHDVVSLAFSRRYLLYGLFCTSTLLAACGGALLLMRLLEFNEPPSLNDLYIITSNIYIEKYGISAIDRTQESISVIMMIASSCFVGFIVCALLLLAFKDSLKSDLQRLETTL